MSSFYPCLMIEEYSPIPGSPEQDEARRFGCPSARLPSLFLFTPTVAVLRIVWADHERVGRRSQIEDSYGWIEFELKI